jgi:hypothetical protein
MPRVKGWNGNKAWSLFTENDPQAALKVENDAGPVELLRIQGLTEQDGDHGLIELYVAGMDEAAPGTNNVTSYQILHYAQEAGALTLLGPGLTFTIVTGLGSLLVAVDGLDLVVSVGGDPTIASYDFKASVNQPVGNTLNQGG